MKNYEKFNKLNESQLDDVLEKMLGIHDSVTKLLGSVSNQVMIMKKEHISLKKDYDSLKKLVMDLRDSMELEEPEEPEG